MLFRQRQAVGLVSWSWIKVTARTIKYSGSPNRLTAQSFLHTQSVHWRKNDDEEELRSQLFGFRPLGPNPLHALAVNDATRSSTAMQNLQKGQAIVYTGGDFHNARQMLQAVKRKCAGRSGAQRRRKRSRQNNSTCDRVDQTSILQQWMKQKQSLREQSEILNRILIQVSIKDGKPSHIMGLKRAPDNAREVFSFAFQNDEEIPVSNCDLPVSQTNYSLLSLNDYLAMVGGYEWYQKGVYINALQGYIFPHFGVFPPTRQDYNALLDNINVDRTKKKHIRMMEVGIGSGVLSILLLKQKKVDHVIGTDINPNAIACSKDNMARFGFDKQVDLVQTDMFPTKATTNDDDANEEVDVVLFNPPWIPGDATSWLDRAVYDSDQSLLRRFLSQVQHYVNEDGHVYLLLSNLGMLLGLFQAQDLMDMFEEGNLEVVEVHRTEPREDVSKKRRTKDLEGSSIASARAQEVISLYHLRIKKQ